MPLSSFQISNLLNIMNGKIELTSVPNSKILFNIALLKEKQKLKKKVRFLK